MMRDAFSRPPPLGATPQAGPVTRALSGLLLMTTLCLCVTERRGLIGPSDFIFERNSILAGEVWRLITYMFVQADSSLALVISIAMLWLFGGLYEARWGSRTYLRFFVFAGVGAALLAVPFGIILDFVLPFRDVGLAEGPGAVIDAMLVAAVMRAPDSPLLFGFVLPIPARYFIWIAIGIQAIGGVMHGVASLGITLGGMAMGYLLLTGLWHPKRAIARIRMHIDMRKKRRGLYVVPPRSRRRDMN